MTLLLTFSGMVAGSYLTSDVEKMKAEADIVVVAKILSAELDSTSFRGELYQYKLHVVSVEKGKLKETELLVTYENLVAHQRGEMRVWPLANGSGIESDLKVDESYCLYLRRANPLEILLAEKLNES